MYSALIILATALAVSIAAPSAIFYHGLEDIHYPYWSTLRYPFDFAASQYHSQDGFGQYSFGYNTLDKSRSEVRGIDGTTLGSYSYVDSNGQLQTVNYRAGVDGFHAAGTNLPVAPIADLPPVMDTPEVMEARAKHLMALENGGIMSEAPPMAVAVEAKSLPEPVTDEPIIAQAKINHLNVQANIEHEHAILKSFETPIIAAAPITYSAIEPIVPVDHHVVAPIISHSWDSAPIIAKTIAPFFGHAHVGVEPLAYGGFLLRR